MKNINWGIVGLGKIANKFAQDLQYVKGARLHAVASRSIEKAEEFSDQYQTPYRYGSYEALLNCPDLDAVYISTPHVFHCQNSLMFLEKGIAVLCEKPLGMNRAEVELMVSKAKTHNTFLMEAMWTRFFPLIQRAVDLADRGELGKLKTLRADFGFHKGYAPNDRVMVKNLGGGGILDVGIYPLFMSLLFFGKPHSVYAKSTFNEFGVDETTHIVLEYENNRTAQLFCSINDMTDVEASLYGSEGKLKLHTRFHHPKKITYGKYYDKEISEYDKYPGFGYHLEIKAVCDDLRAGRIENQLMSHQLSLDLIELLDRVRFSAGMLYKQDQK